MIAHPQRIRHNRQRGIHGGAGTEKAALHDIQIVYVMRLAIAIQRRSLRIIAKANRARAHPRYVLAWLDQQHIQRAHLVGFSMGGGVALNLADIAPERVASITMLSAIGMQEMELLGDYHLNHAIHGAQLAGL